MSINVKVYNLKAEETGKLELSEKVFAVKSNNALVHQAMVAQMANERQVLADTKDRSEVRGGGKKPWRQKGTGRARAGSSRSPIWIGGGVTFGPTNDRNFKKDINKKMKQKALCMVVSDRVRSENFLTVEHLDFTEFKTKQASETLSKLSKNLNNTESKKRSILVINDKKQDEAKYSFRNLVGVKFINIENINILDLLKFRNLIITAECAKSLEKRYK